MENYYERPEYYQFILISNNSAHWYPTPDTQLTHTDTHENYC